MEGPPLGPGGEDITWPDQVAPRGRKASSTRKIKPQTSNLIYHRGLRKLGIVQEIPVVIVWIFERFWRICLILKRCLGVHKTTIITMIVSNISIRRSNRGNKSFCIVCALLITFLLLILIPPIHMNACCKHSICFPTSNNPFVILEKLPASKARLHILTNCSIRKSLLMPI